ncbi:MAG: polysaccharide deacetylase family protein [Cyclobacteriaceae bacterium]|nr:polysaccharide deacetylase family protein [Cyclobacteriaceae bacterium]
MISPCLAVACNKSGFNVLTLNFFRSPFFLHWIYKDVVWRMPAEAKELYLTFDDGPVPGPTEFVLEELKKHNLTATFFCIGDNVRKHQAIFQKIIEAGHSIGNHTFNHLSGWKTSNADYLKNIHACDEQMVQSFSAYREGNDKRNLFRPPYGRITPSQVRSLKEYKIVMWDVLTHDYAKSLSSEQCLRGSIGATRPGSIIVFHDSVKAERNMTYVLPRYIDHFLSEGYVFKSLH